MKFTKKERYEIEKMLDYYAAEINTVVNRYCQTMIHWSAVKKIGVFGPLDDSIKELKKSYDFIKKLRDKFEEERLK